MSRWRYAFSLSKAEVAEAEPPGTVRLIEHENNDHIALIPPPTLNPADPLNWPRWRKYAVLLTMSFYALAGTFAQANIASALPIIMFQLPRAANTPPPGYGELSHLIAYNVLMIGLGNIIWVPCSNIFGRRPVLILALAVTVGATIWCGKADSFDSLLAARIVQGFGIAPADSVAPHVIGECFFVHQRGRAIAFYSTFLSVGSILGGLVGGYIAGNLGYRYLFWIALAPLAFTLVAQILFVPETIFDRQGQMEQDQLQNTTIFEKAEVDTVERVSDVSHSSEQEHFTFARSLRVGVYRGHIVKNFLAPWKSLLFPGTWLVCLHYGGILGGLVATATVGPQFLAAPPYLWGNNVGLINVGGLVGVLIGGASTYIIVDVLTKRYAKRDRTGLAEPEARLPIMFPALIIATAGIWCFGFSAGNPGTGVWAGMVVGLGMISYALLSVPSVGFSYLIDSYGPLAADAFVMTTIARGVVSFAYSFFVSNWVMSAGPEIPFGVFGGILGLFTILTVPVWLFGKRMRIATAGLLPSMA
ncbi:putative MFS-type transporter [Cercospora beticola]|uniref:Putative MFS-type transporter n=1 Tax=Cercospora beticola TaxID=122368 RepID=A0A2G5HGY7_CERBT|nr:putative MFS-type transporter [Cercospora beticola]PIA91801.1 putative MFS-type transporter [Cercospora beticola]WPB06240.1 hypothetical protein RHO25_010897 [Cercospora beticola]CAK1366123.1 unnamed protein product [Cercospora beticola]